MSRNWTPTTKEVRDTWHDEMFPNASDAAFDRWLTDHDAEIRADALLKASEALGKPMGIQSAGGVGFLYADSLAGAARYLRQCARNAKRQS